MKKSTLPLFVLFAMLLLSSCSGDKKGHEHGHDHGHDHSHDSHDHASGSEHMAEATKPQFEVDSKFQKQLSSVFASYVDLQEALVESNPAEVRQEASETTDALAAVDMTLVTGVAHNDWMTYASPMQASLKEIQTTEDLEAQRKSFSTLSDNLYKSIKAFGLGGGTAYYTFCPMAFNDQGGYWLSDEAKVNNPYFGDKMLTCGQVKEKLQ